MNLLWIEYPETIEIKRRRKWSAMVWNLLFNGVNTFLEQALLNFNSSPMSSKSKCMASVTVVAACEE